MFKDAELDRLGRARDRAYEALRLAREEKNRLGKECSKLHDELDEAYSAQNRAYESQQAAWESHRSFMQDCSEKIKFYQTESDRHHSSMVSAFQQASDSHNARDGAGAKSWANVGHSYKAQMRSDKEQISYWVSQSRDAKYRFESSSFKSDFDRAKQLTARLKTEFAEISNQYKPVKALLEQKQAEFDKAKKAFDDRLNHLKSESSMRSGVVNEKSTIYARFRSGHDPISIPAKVFYDRNKPDGPFHLTMKYNDGYRVSWDATSHGDVNFHWTNENAPKGSKMRHIPPDDASVR
jgi:uncharacterized coiled-coil DUF342 family protein